MDLSHIKLVVSDMDGTLLNSNHEVSPLFFELFRKLRQKGVLFAAASGRQYGSIVDKLASIKNDIIVIAENGGFAVHQGQEIVSTPLGFNLRKKVFSALEGVENVHAVLCSKDSAYLSFESQNFLETLKEYYTSFELLEDLKSFPEEVMKVAVYHHESSEKYIYPAVRHLEGTLKVKVSGANWVDLSHKDAHKGFALQKVQENYGITPEQTLVFGDYNNDLEMMARSDYSFAMANAHPNVLKAAKFKTSNNDSLGVERVLEKLIESL